MIVLLPEEPGNAADILRDAGVDVLTAPLHRLRALSWTNIIANTQLIARFRTEVAGIENVIIQRGIDVVLINGLVNPHGAIAADNIGVPVVWQLLDTATPRWLRRMYRPVLNRYANVVMTTGMEVARSQPGAMEFGQRLVAFFPPVDTSVFRPNSVVRGTARERFGVPQGSLVVGTVANLTYQKGHEFLLRACKRLKDLDVEFFVRILGGSMSTQRKYEHDLRKEAEEFGLFENRTLEFLDPGSRVHEYLPGLDIFVMPSRHRSEGIPTTVLEAMACGIPVVAARVGAVEEAVLEGHTGMLVPAEHPESMATAICRLISDSPLRHEMGIRARQRALELFDVSACADAHEKAFSLATSLTN
jgi:glycosyltransferase involved in cell wall biosynthesis